MEPVGKPCIYGRFLYVQTTVQGHARLTYLTQYLRIGPQPPVREMNV